METFNRVELKYVLPFKKYLKIRNFISSLLVRDKSASQGTYNVYSTYFDTPELTYYYEKIDGFENRKKIRIRHYDDPLVIERNSFIGLEIKEKRNNVILKNRMKISSSDALSLIKRSIYSENNNFGDFTQTLQWENLRPAVQTCYRREAFFQKNDRNLRITYDFENHARVFDLSTRKLRKEVKHLMPPEIGILEIKAYEKIPYWLQRVIRENELELQKVSKYCLSIEAWYNYISTNRNFIYG